MGLGFQLVHWPDAFCQQLADHGFYVVRFDNRDAGRSTHLPGAGYTLEDVADDAVGLLDARGSAPRTSLARRSAAWSPSSWPSGIPRAFARWPR
jgi:pimeloyl-ACP methyl ester carboxylesterase